MDCLPKFRRAVSVVLGIACFLGALLLLHAQSAQPTSTWSQEDGLRIGNDLRKGLGGLTNYGVFDWITYGDHGTTVILKGYASRPALKSDAERVAKSVAKVDGVDNQIEVLPLSNNDDRIRAAVYNRIFTQPSLRKYNANAGSLRQATGPGRSIPFMAGGITNAPPIGYHAIHIIVNNGNLTLYGVVLNDMDAAIAGVQANTAPGVFSVDNDLIVERSSTKEAAK